MTMSYTYKNINNLIVNDHFHSITLQIVIVGILYHPPVEEAPCQIINSILLILHCFGNNLSIEMIVKEMIQMRLQRERERESVT